MKPKLLVSACLLGRACRYDGASKPHPDVINIIECFDIILICPECDGGLPTPRVPSEIVGDRVLNSCGEDVTAEYSLGAKLAVTAAIENGCRYALLKARSPSCGNDEIYDGTFSKNLIKGSGITAAALMNIGVKVYNEEQIELLLKNIM